MSFQHTFIVSIPEHCKEVLSRRAAFRRRVNPDIETTVETLIEEAVREYVEEIGQMEAALNPKPKTDDPAGSSTCEISG